jgi:TPR repeat protein
VAPAKNAPTSALVPLPATSRTTTFSTSPTVAGEQLGQQEYLAAQDVLKNKNSEAGVPEAVRLLWIAVEKGNSNAEVTLAELYRQGQGVAKSCDQTKILLTAAARKGNVEAQKRLEQFQQEGCE